METVAQLLVVMFCIGSCGAFIALSLTLIDYVHTLTGGPRNPQPSSEQLP
jgi:hypothetical protein